VATNHGLLLTTHRHDIYGRCVKRTTCPRWAERQSV
jgi:hypothetical protein